MDTKQKARNPVSRLHEFVIKAKRYPQDPSQPARVWAHAFDIPIGDHKNIRPDGLMVVVQRLSELTQLVEDVETGLREIPDIAERYFEPFSPIRGVLFNSLQGLNQNHGGLLNPVTERHLTLLEVAADEWDRHKPELEIDEEQLKKILTQTRELFEEVKTAQIQDGRLKKLLLSMLTAIEQAIQQFRTRGTESLEEGLVRVVGQLEWNSGIVEKANEEKDSKTWLKKFSAIASQLYALYTFAEKTQKLLTAASPVVGYLIAGDPNIPPVNLPK